MNKTMKRFFAMLLAVTSMITCLGGGIYAETPAASVKKSIFSDQKNLENTITIGKSKPTAVAQPVGEIELEVGQTVTDKGFINTFKTDEVAVGELEYGTMTYSTSISGIIVDDTYYDIQNNPKEITKMTSYISQDYNSAVSVNYDINKQTGGQEISYSFTGNKSTKGKDIYVYYHYYVQGKSASGQEITRGGYLGYKIKVKEKTQNPGPAPTPSGDYRALLSYNANGGKIKGQDTFEDVANRKSAAKNLNL